MEQTRIIEQLVNSDSFTSFRSLYLFRVGKKLETFEQLLDAIANKVVTPEDLFEERLNDLQFSEEQEDFWLSNLELFDFQNYFPSTEKRLENGKGAWIKVKTEDGYQVHFARKATRKLNFHKQYLVESEKILKILSNASGADNSEEMACGINKSKELNFQALKTSVYALIGLQPYEVWYWRTKTQKAYVTPCEYEVVDIQEFVDYIQEKTLKGIVKVRSLFTSRNRDKIFYLRSRGLSSDLAKIYANLESCYFDVNLRKAVDEYAKVNNAAVAKMFA